jgi:hypothetical protein
MAVPKAQLAKDKPTLQELVIKTTTVEVEGSSFLLSIRKPEVLKPDPTLTVEEIVERARYRLNPERDGCTDGTPAAGFTNAIISAARQLPGAPSMTALRGAFFVIGGADGLVPVHAPEPIIRVDGGNNPNKRGAAITIRRPCYSPWSCEFRVDFNAGVLSWQDLLSLINAAGFCVGVGDARPEKCPGIAAGRFRVVRATPAEDIA